MTGLDPWGINMFHNVGGQPLPEGAPMAGCLSDAGYQTHAVGKMHWFPERARYGFDEVECDEEYRKFPQNQLHDYERYLQDQGLAHRMTSHGVGPNQYGWRLDSVPGNTAPPIGWRIAPVTFLSDVTQRAHSFSTPHSVSPIHPLWCS